MMRFLWHFFWCFAACLPLLLVGCASAPQEKEAAQVAISDGVWLSLPAPAELGYALTASQMVTASWQEQGKLRSEQLPVHLQVDRDSVVLAGFSSWGTRIMSLDYRQNQVSTDVMVGLAGVLPAPEQILFNLMITLWPAQAWVAPLNQIGWSIKELPLSRQVVDQDGQTVITINYDSTDKLHGAIEFHHHQYDAVITIKTLQFQTRQP